MYKVFVVDVEFSRGLDLETSVQLALNLYRSSNTGVEVCVFDSDAGKSVIKFYRVSDKFVGVGAPGSPCKVDSQYDKA